jgi:hypothetical protein
MIILNLSDRLHLQRLRPVIVDRTTGTVKRSTRVHRLHNEAWATRSESQSPRKSAKRKKSLPARRGLQTELVKSQGTFANARTGFANGRAGDRL